MNEKIKLVKKLPTKALAVITATSCSRDPNLKKAASLTGDLNMIQERE